MFIVFVWPFLPVNDRRVERIKIRDIKTGQKVLFDIAHTAFHTAFFIILSNSTGLSFLMIVITIYHRFPFSCETDDFSNKVRIIRVTPKLVISSILPLQRPVILSAMYLKLKQ